MKIKKIVKMFDNTEWIRIWGDDEDTPIWEGYIDDIPYRLINKELIVGPDGVYIDIRYRASDKVKDHIAIFVEGE